MLEQTNYWKRLTSLTFTAMVVGSLAACGGGGGSSSNSGPLEGVWNRACHIDDEGDYVTERLNFSGSSFEYQLTFYQFLDCTSPLYNIRSTGTFSIGEPVDISAQITATKINETYTKIYETPLNASITTFNNTNTFCGYSNWETNKETDVTNCSNYSGIIGTHYDIFYINGSNLTFGDDDFGDGTSDATRPTELETKPYSK